MDLHGIIRFHPVPGAHGRQAVPRRMISRARVSPDGSKEVCRRNPRLGRSEMRRVRAQHPAPAVMKGEPFIHDFMVLISVTLYPRGGDAIRVRPGPEEEDDGEEAEEENRTAMEGGFDRRDEMEETRRREGGNAGRGRELPALLPGESRRPRGCCDPSQLLNAG